MVRSWGLQFWGGQSSNVPKLHRPRSPEWLYGQVMGSAALEFWWGDQSSKVPKLHGPIGLQSGYGQASESE